MCKWLFGFFAGCCFLPIQRLQAATVRLEVSRDNWVSAVGSEAEGNNGGSARLKTKGIQEFVLFDMDVKPLVGKTIQSATLHFKAASADPQRRVTVSTVATEWVEGTGSGYAVQAGSSCFNWAAHGKTRWAGPASDLTGASLGMGNTIWRFAEAAPPDRDGWQRVAVDPEIVSARLAGVSKGFVLFDDVGSEYDRNGDAFKYKLFLNRYIFSREQGNSRPYLVVNTGEADEEGPLAVPQLRQLARVLPAGEALVTWFMAVDRGAAGVSGYLARYSEGEGEFKWESAKEVPQYLVPMDASRPMHLRDLGLSAGKMYTLGVRAVDNAGNVGAVSTVVFKTSNAAPVVELGPVPVKRFEKTIETVTATPAVSISIVDALDKIHPVSGAMIPERDADYLRANHLFSAAEKKVRLFGARGELVDFQIVLSGAAENLSAELKFENAAGGGGDGGGAMGVKLHRFRNVSTKAGPLPDPLVPLEGVFSIPAKDEKIDGQKHVSLLAEVYVPKGAKPGRHVGTLTIRNGETATTLAVELTVWNFALPDQLSFLAEMNCYGLPDGPEDVAYYRLAHEHRTTLNRLGYSWRGTVNDGCGPKWNGKDFEWGEYDRHYGPLLDGSAFADAPRKGVPVEAFYLPLNENWPLDVNKHFKGGYWADSAFDAEYFPKFAEACGKFAAHVSEKKWNGTFFEFYLNNKVYFKDKSWSRCSAPWVFDEPVNTQDFWALRQYGIAFHRAIAGKMGDARLAFRCDISRPEWQRDLLDGLLDVNIVGASFRQYNRFVVDRKMRDRQLVINYGSTNPITESNVQPAGWCIDAWRLGADGVLPWQTVGKSKSWEQADELSLFYPGKPAGLRGPVPSIRLKAYRRGQQDVEYLTILRESGGYSHFAVAGAVASALKLKGDVQQRDSADAGLVSFKGLDPVALWELRMRVGAMLDKAAPADKRQWVELRTPERDVANLKDYTAQTGNE